MKNVPEKIYLQIGEDCDAEDFDELTVGQISWCVDKIYKNDIEYSCDTNQLPTPSAVKEGAVEELLDWIKSNAYHHEGNWYLHESMSGEIYTPNQLHNKYLISKAAFENNLPKEFEQWAWVGGWQYFPNDKKWYAQHLIEIKSTSDLYQMFLTAQTK